MVYRPLNKEGKTNKPEWINNEMMKVKFGNIRFYLLDKASASSLKPKTKSITALFHNQKRITLSGYKLAHYTRKDINDINEPGMKYKRVFKSWSDEMNWVNGAQSESRLAKL